MPPAHGRVVELTVDATAPRHARDVVRSVLQQAELDGQVLDDCLLVATELVDNAVLHGGSFVRLEVTPAAGCVEIAVQDGSSVLPVARAPGADGGRGLLILNALAEWGVESLPDGGKRVWARVAVPVPDGAG